jgi:hypothetical protein
LQRKKQRQKESAWNKRPLKLRDFDLSMRLKRRGSD